MSKLAGREVQVRDIFPKQLTKLIKDININQMRYESDIVTYRRADRKFID